jgi:hypothetical protein
MNKASNRSRIVRWWCGGLLLLWMPSACAQLSIGITVGGTITSDFVNSNSGAYILNSGRLLIGPTVRLRTRSGIAIEGGALHKRIGFGYSFGRPGLGFTEYTVDAADWQFPFVLQYGRTLGSVTPYVGAGPVLRWITGGTQKGRNCTSLPSVVCTSFSQSQLSDIRERTTGGILIGAGLEIRAAFASLSPEVRFTRWLGQPFIAPIANDNQLQILLRIAPPITRN